MTQVAYLMADISSVKYEQIKDIQESLEALSCKWFEADEEGL